MLPSLIDRDDDWSKLPVTLFLLFLLNGSFDVGDNNGSGAGANYDAMMVLIIKEDYWDQILGPVHYWIH